MGIFKRLFGQSEASNRRSGQGDRFRNSRRCGFETMEERRVLAANPIVAGVTFLAYDDGQDLTPDYFEVSFVGGSATTQMTQFTINGDQDGNGVPSRGDIIFHVSPEIQGAGGYHPFKFHAGGSIGVTESDILSVEISNNGLMLTVTLKNFVAGDRLAFTLDTDEVETLRVDPIVSGVEMEGSLFQTVFYDPHYNIAQHDFTVQTVLNDGWVQTQRTGMFFDEYDTLFNKANEVANDTLNLSGQNQTGLADHTAGAVTAFKLTPRPISISGKVFHDENLNCVMDGNEKGIAGVVLSLEARNPTTGQYQQVATTTTDQHGNYVFDTSLGLMPGHYRVVQTQPEGFLSVCAKPGTVEGQTTGTVVKDGANQPNVITDIFVPLGGLSATNFDFSEVRPVNLSGYVYHDRNDNGIREAGEEGLANVLIRVTRVGTSLTSHDPFADQAPIHVRTDAQGRYEVVGLAPGIYEIVQVNTYPDGDNPLAGFLDGKDTVGTIGGTKVGTLHNDRFTNVKLRSGQSGVEYNFGELRPVSVSGFVGVTTPQGNCVDPLDPSYKGIAGVTIQLFDSQGKLVATTQTLGNGSYVFNQLRPGTYSIIQTQPTGFLDGGDRIGTVGGIVTGLNPVNDTFTGIVLASGQSGINYNFCEHMPASLSGYVWHDRNDDGLRQAGEEGISGVTVQLLDAQGTVVTATTTNGQGYYEFKELLGGTYTIRQVQPTGWIDGKDRLGTIDGVVNGVLSNNHFSNIQLLNGQNGLNYDFGEFLYSTINGRVHANTGPKGDCHFDEAAGDRPLQGVTIILLDGQGNEVTRTLTNAEGRYTFKDLRPGTYSVVEIQPDGYLEGRAWVGTIGGTNIGNTAGSNRIDAVRVTSGQSGLNYDFCEHIPAEISGFVWHDRNNDGQWQRSSEQGIGGVTVRLLDAQGNVVGSAVTNSQGRYQFTNLYAGEYSVQQVQPATWVDGKDSIGMIDGQVVGMLQGSDLFTRIVIRGGQSAHDYNFGEYRLGSIEGYVHTDNNGNFKLEQTQGERPLTNVTLQLLNSQGQVIATTQTNAAGFYRFGDLTPGVYQVRQIQPAELFDIGQVVGRDFASGQAGTGDASSYNRIMGIVVSSEQRLIDYNFVEQAPGVISGRVFENGPAFETEDGNVPSNYRDQRDGVWRPGIDTPLAGVRLTLWYYIDPTTQAIAPRQVTLADVMPGHYNHLGTDPSTPLWVMTDANGQYQFTGLRAGNYIVLQQQPDGYVDGNNTPGTTTGFAFNSLSAASAAPQAMLQKFTVSQIMDAIANIRINPEAISQENNFSEVRALKLPPPPPTEPPVTPPPVNQPPLVINPPGGRLTPPPSPGWMLYGSLPLSGIGIVGVSRGPASMPMDESPYSWHLSVINAGQPRDSELVQDQVAWMQAAYLSASDWNRVDVTPGVWKFAKTNADGSFSWQEQQLSFGVSGGTLVVGDFNGDGLSQFAFFKDGYWLIDINGNFQWDSEDLIVRLGDSADRPVVGDWDGDGKADIGIFGPQWEGDELAIRVEPGLPDAANTAATTPKNLPPRFAHATEGARTMRLTAHGRTQVDLIDHVFGFGSQEDTPVVGDFNGDGIATIGYFRDGKWRLDLNGDGKIDHRDIEFVFGRTGDIPLVGDFNGDGIDQVGIYRNGTWILDINNSRRMDAHNKVFQMGSPGDIPVVGDFNGDGIDTPALYRPATTGPGPRQF